MNRVPMVRFEPSSESEQDDEEQEDQEEEEDTENQFRIHDLLTWNGDSRGTDMDRAQATGFQFNILQLFNTFTMFAILAMAEVKVRHFLEYSGIAIIVFLQKQEYLKESAAFLDTTFAFPPEIWAFLPGVLLACTWVGYGIGSRILLLNGVGRILKWSMIIIFRQGRPFWISDKISMWHCPSLYGCPSGHAMLNLLCLIPILSAIDRRITSPTRNVFTTASLLLTRHCLLLIYCVNLVGRMVVGTHFLHDMLIGVVAARVLMLIFTRQNSRSARRRIISLIQYRKSFWNVKWVAFAELWAMVVSMLAVLFIFVGFVYVLHVHEREQHPDPEIWNRRSLSKCNQPINTGDISPAFDGIAVLMGWYISNIVNGLLKSSQQEDMIVYRKSQYGAMVSAEIVSQNTTDSNHDDMMFVIIRMVSALTVYFLVPFRSVNLFLATCIALISHGPDLKIVS